MDKESYHVQKIDCCFNCKHFKQIEEEIVCWENIKEEDVHPLGICREYERKT